MPLNKTLQCPKCDRKFAREGHLARHVNSIHGKGSKRGPKPKSMRRGRRRVGRPPGSGKRRGPGRPAGGRFGLGKLSLEQLRELIGEAREHAKQRLHKMLAAFQ